MDELLRVLWAYRTTTRKPIGISPFALTYGMEVIIPTKFGMPSIRASIPEQENVELIVEDLDTIDELRESAGIRIASYIGVSNVLGWVKRLRVKQVTGEKHINPYTTRLING